MVATAGRGLARFSGVGCRPPSRRVDPPREGGRTGRGLPRTDPRSRFAGRPATGSRVGRRIEQVNGTTYEVGPLTSRGEVRAGVGSRRWELRKWTAEDAECEIRSVASAH